MSLYRFSPLSTEADLLECVTYLHKTSNQLCFDVFGKYLPVAGNVGIFCHYDLEFSKLVKIKNKITDKALTYNNKYFKLLKPIVIPEEGAIPSATYDYLYIRQPDPYRSQVGDIDFVLEPTEHEAFKRNLTTDTFQNKARIFSRPEDNMIELFDPNKDVLSYVVTSPMRDRV